VATLNLYLHKNVDIIRSTFQNTSYPHVSIVDLVSLEVGDYIELWGSSGVSVSNTLILGQDKLWMSIIGV
jgi:hypothetical protein